MKKMVVVQICLAAVAFVITAWIFFKERPQAEKTVQLQQELTQVKEQNRQLQTTATALQYDRKQSREYIHQGRDLFHQQKYDEAIAYYDKALQSYPDDPYGWSLKGCALLRAGKVP